MKRITLRIVRFRTQPKAALLRSYCYQNALAQQRQLMREEFAIKMEVLSQKDFSSWNMLAANALASLKERQAQSKSIENERK